MQGGRIRMGVAKVKMINLLEIVDGLIVSLLHEGSSCDYNIEAVKVTKRGLYAYKSAKINERGKMDLDGEEILYKGGNKILPYDALVDYIRRRTRVAINTDEKGMYIHTVIDETLELPMTPEVEVEKKFEKATYLYKRDFYFRDSIRGKELQMELGYDLDKVNKVDAKIHIVEDQLKTEEDLVALTLLCNNLQSGMLDNSTKILYKETKSGYEKVTQLQELQSAGSKLLDLGRLGVRIKASTFSNRVQSKGGKQFRSVRYLIQQLSISENIIARFKILRTLQKGIVLVNNTMVEDVLAVFYPFDRNYQDVTLNEYNSHDIMYLDGMPGAPPSYCNPYLQMEAMQEITILDSTISYSTVFKSEVSKVIKTGYSVYIINELDCLTDDLIKAADNSLVIVIDKFNNLEDIKLKLDNLNTESKLQLIGKLSYLLDIKEGALLKANKTVKNLILKEQINLERYPITNYITYKGNRIYYKKFLYKYLEDENTVRFEVQSDHVVVTDSTKEGPKIIKCDVPLASCIQFLSDISEFDIFRDLEEKGKCVIDYRLANTEFKILASLNNSEMCVIFKKIDLAIYPISKYLESTPTARNKVSLIFSSLIESDKNIHNEFAASLISHLALNREKVLIIDNDLSIGKNTFQDDLNISLMQDVAPNNLAEIVSVYKPSYIVVHKITNLHIFNKLLEIAPITKHIFITTKMTNTVDFSLQFVTKENQTLVDYYVQDWLTYNEKGKIWVNTNNPIKNSLKG